MAFVFVAILAFVVGAAVAAALVFRMKKEASAPRQLPRVWPLVLRNPLHSKERTAWRWLGTVFPDQRILYKVSMARFSSPMSGDDHAVHWQKELNAVYCTFAVCARNGDLLGCVDVDNGKTPSVASQQLKRVLLEQWGLPYWVMDTEHLPQQSEMRLAFLGESTVIYEDRERLEHRFKERRQDSPRAARYPAAKNRRLQKREPQIRPQRTGN